MKILVLDLCSGMDGWTAAFRHRGHDCVGMDLNPKLHPDVAIDVAELAADPRKILDLYVRLGWRPDVILAGPPCEGFSVGSIGKMWVKTKDGYLPKHATSRMGLKVLDYVLMAVAKLQPEYYWIENPRGMMRKMPQMAGYRHVEISQCCYGNIAQKMTDLWGRWPKQWNPRPICDAKPKLGVIDNEGRAYNVVDAKGKPYKFQEGEKEVQYLRRRCDEKFYRIEKGRVWVDGEPMAMRVLKPNGLPCHEWAPRGATTGTQGKNGSSERARLPYALSEEVCVALEQAYYDKLAVPEVVQNAWVARRPGAIVPQR